MRLWNRIKCFWRGHRLEDIDGKLKEEILGVGLNMLARPQIVYRWSKKCQKCGRTVTKRGMTSLSDIIMEVERDAEGWPLDKDGSRIPAVKY